MKTTTALDIICAHFNVSETDLLGGDPAEFPQDAALARESLEVLQLWRTILDPDARRRCLDMLRSSAAVDRGAGIATPLQF